MEASMAEGAAQAGQIVNQAFGLVIAMTSLRTILEMHLPQIVPDSGDMQAKEIAKATGAQEDLIVRLMRPLTAIGIFQETAPETYRHSPMSLAFKNPAMQGYMQIGWDMWLPVYGSMHTWFKDHKFQLTDDNATTPFASVYKEPLFKYLDTNPAQAAVFNASMEHLAYPIASIFPFNERLKAAGGSMKLVDIGGGKGQASREILNIAPEYANRIVIQDQASVVEALPEDLKSKVETMPYDFFEPQPLKGEALYYLRNILCDWPDKKCIQILHNQAKAMTTASRLLIATRLMPEANADPMTAAMDICMLTYGGAERTSKHFKSLIEAAGLEVEKVWTVEASPWGVIEAKLAS